MCIYIYIYISNEDPAKSGLESRRILDVEGGVSQHAKELFLLQFSLLFDSKDLALWDLGMNHGHIWGQRYSPFEKRIRLVQTLNPPDSRFVDRASYVRPRRGRPDGGGTARRC